MYVPRRQRGISFLGWVALLFLVGFAGLVALRIVPPYAQYMTLVTVVESIHEDPSLRNAPLADVQQALGTRMRLNEVDHLGKDVVDIHQPDGKLVFTIDYEVVRPLVANVHVLLKFNKRVGP